MDIIITSSTQEIIRQNEGQTRSIDKLVLKQNLDNKLMISEITWSMLEYPSTSDYDDMVDVVSKSTLLEPTIKNQIKNYWSSGSTQFGKEKKKYKSKNIPNGKSFPKSNDMLLNM